MEEEGQGRDKRSFWNMFVVEEGFKQRHIVRLLVLTSIQVAVSTAAFVALHRYEFAVAWQDGVMAPGLLRVTIGWAALMSGVGGLFALWMGLLMTHRIAGPLHAFKKELRRVEAGATPREIRIRRGDELGDVADALNDALRALSLRATSDTAEVALDLEELRSCHEEILAGVAAFEISGLPQADRDRLRGWREKLGVLGSRLDPVRTS